MPKPENLLVNLISLKGKRALITGSASGIGKAIANRFAEAGAELILIDIDDKNLVKTADELKVWGVNVTPQKS